MTTPLSRFEPFLCSVNVPSEMISTKESNTFVEMRASYLGMISVAGGVDLNILVELNNFNPKLSRNINWELFIPVLDKLAHDHFTKKLIERRCRENILVEVDKKDY